LVSTRHESGNVLISVEDMGPAIAPALLPRMFELNVETREGTSQLEMAACEALVQRRLRGRIHGENRPSGGVAVRVRLRPVQLLVTCSTTVGGGYDASQEHHANGTGYGRPGE
jgi:C4-dicarboxylate-specific signal transduction histidine kinase